ncbi:MFS transporter [Paenibacillus sp. 1781tsa1]|uniref:MDR family MFS transporter n=1 Tax=Paenibacillus sp. 1781tsa1 TaxID=2953810 RepID=UPI00209E14DB|nr:MFS transporter [Paenibacillus sp. 1781tsa1]MCP1182757.1 MFS transporter [Paenibacillus sp. 1781tsa1]
MKYADLHPNIRIRIITDFFTDLTQKSIIPFMAIYLSIQIGAGVAGLLLTINIVASMIVGLWAGYWSDRIGRKKLMVIAQTLQVVALLCLAIANSPWMDSIIVTCLMFLLSSLSSGITVPIANAMIVDVSSEHERHYVYGLQYWTTNVAVTFGALMGGLFFESFRFLLFSLVCLESIVTLFILIFIIRETMDKRAMIYNKSADDSGRSTRPMEANAPIQRNILKTYWAVFQDKRFMIFFTATVLAVSLEFQLDKYIAVRLKSEFTAQLFGSDISGLRMFSLIMIINTVLVALVAIPFSRWMGRFQSRSIMTVGMCLYTAGFAVLAFSNWAWLLISSAILLTIGELMYSPVRQVMLAGMIPDSDRAAYMAADGLSYNVAALLGSLGLTIGAFLPSYVMAVLYVLMGLGALIFFRMLLRKAEEQHQHLACADAS